MPRMVFCTLVQIRLTEGRKDFCRGQSGGDFPTFFFPPTSVFFRVLEHVLAKFWGVGEVLLPIGFMETVYLPTFN